MMNGDDEEDGSTEVEHKDVEGTLVTPERRRKSLRLKE